MQQLGAYVVSLTAAAMISGILLSLFPDGPVRGMLKLVCGVFLTVTALSPLIKINQPDLSGFVFDYMSEGESAAALGEDMAQDETLELIKFGLEAYILDKAASLDASVTPEVGLDESGVPVSVRMTGAVSDAARLELEALIAKDLGIPKEDQQWSG